MKKIYILASLALLTSCAKEAIQSPSATTAPTKHFTLHFKGDFTHSYEDMTRASVRLEENNDAALTDIWVLDYATVPGESSPVLLQSIHQSSEDADFGKPSLNLTYGTHTLQLIASKGESPVLSASSLSWQKVKDTFTLTYPVEVVSSTNGNRAPELQRSVGGVKLVMTDAVPTEATEIIITLDRCQSLTLPSLTPSAATQGDNRLQFPTSWKGKSGGSITTYTFIPDEELTTDVTVTVLKTNGDELSNFTVTDVPIKQNRITTLTGEVFNRTNTFSISINDTWDEELPLTF